MDLKMIDDKQQIIKFDQRLNFENDNFSEEMLKPFLKGSESLVEQKQIWLKDKELWQKLRDVAKSR